MLISPFVCLAADNQDYAKILANIRHLNYEEIVKLGDRYIQQNNVDSAIVLYSYVANCYSPNNDDADNYYCVLSCLKAGDAYCSKFLYANALSMYTEGLKINETCTNKSSLVLLYKSVGNLYCFFEDYERGIVFYEKGYEHCGVRETRKLKWSILSNLTCAYCFTGQLKKAKERYAQMVKTMDRTDEVEVFMQIYCQGLIFQVQGNYPEAIRCLHEAERSTTLPEYDCYAYDKLYRMYRDVEMPDSTILYLKKCYELSRQNNMQRMHVQTLKDLAYYYQGRNSDKSIRYFAAYSNLTDSIYNYRQFNRVRNEQLFYEVEKTNNGILRLKLEHDVMHQKLNRQYVIIVASLGFLLLVVIFTLIVWRQKMRIQKVYSDLFTVNQNMLAEEKINKELNNTFRQKIADLMSELQRYQQKAPVGTDEQESDSEGLKGKTEYGGKAILDDESALVLAKKIMQVMEDKVYCDPDFSQERLATLVGSNYKYVSFVINKYYQKSFSQFLNDFRVKEAQQRLVDSSYNHMTIQAIAESVGYKSSATFIRSFRNATGLTPSLYQKMAFDKGKKDFNS